MRELGERSPGPRTRLIGVERVQPLECGVSRVRSPLDLLGGEPGLARLEDPDVGQPVDPFARDTGLVGELLRGECLPHTPDSRGGMIEPQRPSAHRGEPRAPGQSLEAGRTRPASYARTTACTRS